MNKQDLLSSNSFCILPFVHTCIWQSGQAQPCCINITNLGDVKKQSIEEIYSSNNKALINLRKEFLTDKLPESCFKCKEVEDYRGLSYRQHSNTRYHHLLDQIDISSDESLVSNEKIFLWDIRFSNLCNLKCVICHPRDSSRIEDDAGNTRLISAFDNTDEFINYFEKQIDNVVEIYFAGGESLLIEDHYKILDLFIKHKKFDVALRYNTNATVSSLKDREITEYWKHFNHVRISVSLDAGWEQFEYIRFGSKWEIALENLRRFRSEVPHVYIHIGIVVTILNIFYIRQLHEFLVNENIIRSEDMYFLVVYGRIHLRPETLPDRLKEKALAYYKKWQEETVDQHLFDQIKLIINMLGNTNTQPQLAILKNKMAQFDKSRNTNFFETFKELEGIFDDVQ
jgi:MoaA/NifB/PqqE/SkfB family radical SAM enzyme